MLNAAFVFPNAGSTNTRVVVGGIVAASPNTAAAFRHGSSASSAAAFFFGARPRPRFCSPICFSSPSTITSPRVSEKRHRRGVRQQLVGGQLRAVEARRVGFEHLVAGAEISDEAA